MCTGFSYVVHPRSYSLSWFLESKTNLTFLWQRLARNYCVSDVASTRSHSMALIRKVLFHHPCLLFPLLFKKKLCQKAIFLVRLLESAVCYFIHHYLPSRKDHKFAKHSNHVHTSRVSDRFIPVGETTMAAVLNYTLMPVMIHNCSFNQPEQQQEPLQ